MVRVLDNDDVKEALTTEKIVESFDTLYEELARGDAITSGRHECITRTSEEQEYYKFKTYGGTVPSLGVHAQRVDSDIVQYVETEDGSMRREKLAKASGGRYTGFVILFDCTNGSPLAFVPDGYMQPYRVAASSAIGTKYLARDDSTRLGVIGSGKQAEAHLAATLEVADIESAMVYSPTEENRRAFAERTESMYDIQVEPVSSPETAFDSDIVQVATNARTPTFDAEWLDQGMHLGTININETDPNAMDYCDRTVVHRIVGEERSYSADIDDTEPIVQDIPPKTDAYPTLLDVISGDEPGRQNRDETTFFFNNGGIGFQFAVCGALVYEAATEQDLGQKLPDDLFTQDHRN